MDGRAKSQAFGEGWEEEVSVGLQFDPEFRL